MPRRTHNRRRKKRHKKRKHAIDSIKQQEIDEKIAKVEAKRQAVINIVKNSLRKRREEKLAIEHARLENVVKERQKTLRDVTKSKSELSMSKIREDMSAIVEAGISAVYTSNIIHEKIKFDGKGTLTVDGTKYKVKNNIHLVGWGKEVVSMAPALERIVNNQLKKGWIVVPRKSISMMWNYPEAFPKLNSRINYIEAGTNGQPDDKAVNATLKIVNYCKKLKKRDLLIVMISHDVDDLLCCPRENVSLKDKLRVLNRLEANNASPEEIYVVRNKLSAIRGADCRTCYVRLKNLHYPFVTGGELARAAYPAKIIVLMTSALSAEPLRTYGGGPCTYDAKNLTAYQFLAKYGLIGKMSQSAREVFENVNPTQSPADKQLDEKNNYKFVEQYVIACNADAMNRMAEETFKFGMFPVKLNSMCTGTVAQVAREYVKIASLMILAVEKKINKLEMYDAMRDNDVCPLTEENVLRIFPVKDKWALGLCLLLGGKPVIDVTTELEKGGPNQELALYFSLYWHLRTKQYPILNAYTVWFLGGSSTGKDGNTNDVGAFGYKSIATDIYSECQKAKRAYNVAHVKERKLAEYEPHGTATMRAQKETKELYNLWKKHEDIVPDSALEKHNTNLTFQCMNHGEDLLRLKTGNCYTFTNVGDLHIIRIVRYQCNCDGTCHGGVGRICKDLECPVAETLNGKFGTPTEQHCCKLGSRKNR